KLPFSTSSSSLAKRLAIPSAGDFALTGHVVEGRRGGGPASCPSARVCDAEASHLHQASAGTHRTDRYRHEATLHHAGEQSGREAVGEHDRFRGSARSRGGEHFQGAAPFWAYATRGRGGRFLVGSAFRHGAARTEMPSPLDCWAQHSVERRGLGRGI